MSVEAGYEQAAWSWTEHLRHGGTRPWTDWLSSGCGAGTVVPEEWSVPGAAQLEVVRRLATLGSVDGRGFTRLADLVLGRPAPGRGLAHLPLWWPDQPSGRRFGAPPVDPSAVPEQELLRVTVGSIAELALQAPAAEQRSPRRWVARGPRIGVVGAPVTAEAVRRRLGLTARRPGRVREVVIVVQPLDQLLAEVWSARVQRGAPVRWPGFVRRWSGRADLPPAADLAGLAREAAERVGAEHVHVVAASPGVEPATAVAEVLGLRIREGGGPPRLRDLSPEAVDLCRRVNAVLAVRVERQRHRAALAGLVPRLPAPDPRHGLTVPRRRRRWARSRAEGLAEDLCSGGYRVHGDIARLVPGFAGVTGPDRGEELAVALAACAGLGEEWVEEWAGG